MQRTTVLHHKIASLCESFMWMPWDEYFVPDSIMVDFLDEYKTLRNHAALYDVSPLGKYHVTGPDALKYLNHMFTRNISALSIGRVCYSPWCDEEGKVRQDGTVFRLSEQHYMIIAGEPDYDWFESHATCFDIALENRTHNQSALALQGPKSAQLLNSVSDLDVNNLKYFGIGQCCIDGKAATVSRTGFTGELGYELWLENDVIEDVWTTLMEGGKPHSIRHCGFMSMDIARLEAGLLYSGVDYIPSQHTTAAHLRVSPFEIGLGWTIDIDKEYFIGIDKLKLEAKQDPKKTLIGIEFDIPALIALYAQYDLEPNLPSSVNHDSVPVYKHGEHTQIGRVTSRVFSPTLEKYIGMGIVDKPYYQTGNIIDVECTIGYQRATAKAKLVELPFVNLERKVTPPL